MEADLSGELLGRLVRFAFVLFGVSAIALNAVELKTACVGQGGNACSIGESYRNQSIENNQNFSSNGITIETPLVNFINNGTINLNGQNLWGRQPVQNFANYGTITNAIISLYGLKTLSNYGNIEGNYLSITGSFELYNEGVMSGVKVHTGSTVIVDNIGTINLIANANGTKGSHFEGGNIVIKNYAIEINKNASSFNNFNGVNDRDNSHLVLNYMANPSFQNADSKIILRFGDKFEFGKEYLRSKLVVDESGNNKLPVDISRITMKNKDIYKLTQNGEYFSVNYANASEIRTPITELQKANVKSMNNMLLNSSTAIYPRKFGTPNNKSTRNTNRNTKTRTIRKTRKMSSLFYNRGDSGADSRKDSSMDSPNAVDSSADSPNSNALLAFNALKSNETFFYNAKLASNDANTRAIRLRRLPSKGSYRLNQTTNRANQTTKTAIRPATQAKDKYYFILTPFVNHNHYFEAGNYNLSGLDYGFVSAFSGKVASNNALGVHFGFSYGSLSDKNDKLFSVNNINIMVGLNYRLDLIWDMYFKARGDFFYFINEVSSEQVAKTKADNVGFGAVVSYGKDFSFGNAGILGVELGIDYKVLLAKDLNIKSAFDNTNMQNYDKARYHLIYADLGLNYGKYFGTVGLNVGAGIRGNLASQLAKSKLIVSENTLNVLLDNDKFFGYANAGVSYVLNAKTFDMEFSLSYYGSFGDRAMSNGGGFEWIVKW